MKEVAGFVVALDGDHAAVRRQVTGDNRADRVEPAADRLVKRLAGVGRNRKRARRMEPPGGVEVERAAGRSRLHRRIEQHPFRKAEIGQLGIDQRSGPDHQPEPALLAERHERVDVLAVVDLAPVVDAGRDFVNRPGDVGLDHPEAELLHPVEDFRPERPFQAASSARCRNRPARPFRRSRAPDRQRDRIVLPPNPSRSSLTIGERAVRPR